MKRLVPVLAAALVLSAGAALAQTATMVQPTAIGNQFATINGGIAASHLAVGGTVAGQLVDGGAVPTSGSVPPLPVQLTAGANTLTAAQLVSGSIFWLNSSSAGAVTLPAPAAGLRGFLETDGTGTLTVTSPGPFLNLPNGSVSIVLSQPWVSTALIWADGASWHVGSIF